MSSNQGFVNLHSAQGAFLVLASSVLLIAIIVFGGQVARMMEASQKRERAALRERLEARRHEGPRSV